MKIVETKSFGVVPIFKGEGGLFFCIIQHASGHWGFPKGHQDMGESEQETAMRELKEETGVSAIDFLDSQSFTIKYLFEKDGFKYNKSVKYFLGLVSSMITTIPDSFKKEITNLKWVTHEEAKNIITFPEERRILDQAFKYL